MFGCLAWILLHLPEPTGRAATAATYYLASCTTVYPSIQAGRRIFSFFLSKDAKDGHERTLIEAVGWVKGEGLNHPYYFELDH